MKSFLNSKNYLITLLIVGLVFVAIVVVQFVSIASLNHKNDQLGTKLNSLVRQEEYYEDVLEEASKDDYYENYAKNEENMKNDKETVYKGS